MQALPGGPPPAGRQQCGEVVGAPHGHPLPPGPAVHPLRAHGGLAGGSLSPQSRRRRIQRLNASSTPASSAPSAPCGQPRASSMPATRGATTSAAASSGVPRRPGRPLYPHHHLPHHVSHGPVAVDPLSVLRAPGCGAKCPVAASRPRQLRPRAPVSAAQLPGSRLHAWGDACP